MGSQQQMTKGSRFLGCEVDDVLVLKDNQQSVVECYFFLRWSNTLCANNSACDDYIKNSDHSCNATCTYWITLKSEGCEKGILASLDQYWDCSVSL